MAELFLTSSIGKVANDVVRRVDLSKGNKLVFISTPVESLDEDIGWMERHKLALKQAGWDVCDYTITGKDAVTIARDLDEFDFIYISGGDTWYLLQQSLKTGFVDVVKNLVYTKGKIYIGTSAGSIIAGSRIPAYLVPEDAVDSESREGYGFVNFTIVPHWGREDFRERYLETRLQQVYCEPQVPFLLLTDYQYVHVKDGKVEIVDVTSA